jgi:hypothetical protein
MLNSRSMLGLLECSLPRLLRDACAPATPCLRPFRIDGLPQFTNCPEDPFSKSIANGNRWVFPASYGLTSQAKACCPSFWRSLCTAPLCWELG